MANFPGSGNAIPGVYSQVLTQSRGAAVPGGTRIAAIIGEGVRSERLISSALGGGKDGLNSTYTSFSNSDGRHFVLSNVPIISNRTTLFKNGLPLTLLEHSITGSSFDARFDARIDISNGQIELQTAKLVDQGGAYFVANSINTGTGTITGLTLVDLDAPTESWTVRCTSVRRDGYGNPIDGYARFIVQGTVSGIILNSQGDQIAWQSNATTVSNGILSFAISEGSVKFVEGDKFTIKVNSGTLVKGDSLSATYIAVADLNDPEFFDSMTTLTAKHGFPSLVNRLSLGGQLAFSNGTPGVLAVEAAPSVPRRLSYALVNSASGATGVADNTFALPLNIIPDVNSKVHFFVTDPTTGIETQILPNKVAFYNSTYTTSPTAFIVGGAFNFSYTVVLESAVEKAGVDGVLSSISGNTAKLSSASVEFDLSDLNGFRTVNIFDATHSINNGTATIVSILNGVVTLNKGGGFAAESNIRFQVLDSSETSARILFTNDMSLSLGQKLRATVVDEKDAAFFDAGWLNAYDALTKIDCDIVVPLPSQTISAIFAIGSEHVREMSDIKNRRERILFIGAIQGLTPDNVLGNKDAAVEDIGVLEGIQGDSVSEILAGNVEDLTNYKVQDAFGSSFRVVYFYPDQIVMQVGADRVFADGFFTAAAAAGFFSGTAYVATPLTNKNLAGFTILRNKLFSPLTIENLAAGGITVLQPVIGGGNVVWGKTTTTSGAPEEEEISIVFIRDRIAKSMRDAFKGFIGQAETPTFISTLFARANGMMQAFTSQRLITDFRGLEVKRDSVDPRQWNLTVEVQPVFPVNWIFISIGIGVL